MDEMQELLHDFIYDCKENLDGFENSLLELEKNPNSPDILDSMFRNVHNIKGASGFLAFTNMENVSHKVETVLDSLRTNPAQTNNNLISIFLEACDAMKNMFGTIKSHGNDGENSYDEICKKLLGHENEKQNYEDQSDIGDEDLDPIQIKALKRLGEYQSKNENSTLVTENEKQKIEQVKETIRVDVDSLDKLMNLTGELVLARNQLLDQNQKNNNNDLEISLANLNSITTEIQKQLMTTRMQPISKLWSKFPRIIRDLSQQLGKEIGLEMRGEATELDKAILEAISDPMTHIIRNCCDHGIESPENRLAQGKEAVGHILLSAEHRGNLIHIDIIDDGKGISLDSIKEKAYTIGLYDYETLEEMSEQEVLETIFQPGFSTKDQASNISGRGVGMDVIKSNIKKLNGTVSLNSKEGEGTHLKITLPLTMAIIPALMIENEEETFAIPQSAIQEVVNVDKDDLKNFDIIEGKIYARLRDEVLPLVSLSKTLNGKTINIEELNSINYIVIDSDGYNYGLIVDNINNFAEIVVKPLGQEDSYELYSGATITGEGKVALILDQNHIAQFNNLSQNNNSRKDKEYNRETHTDSKLALSFKLNKNRTFVSKVNESNRIVEFDNNMLENKAGNSFINLDGKIAQYISLYQILNIGQAHRMQIRALYTEYKGQAFVFDIGTKHELIKDDYTLEENIEHEIIAGTTLIDGQICEVVDLERYLSKFDINENSTSFTETNLNEDTLKENSVLSFKLNDINFGFELDTVSEIIETTTTSPVPSSQEDLKGVLNLRGEVIGTKELAKILRLKVQNNENTKNLIINNDDRKLSIEINSFTEILKLDENSYQKAPENLPEDINKYLKGAYNVDNSLLLILDERKILETAQ